MPPRKKKCLRTIQRENRERHQRLRGAEATPERLLRQTQDRERHQVTRAAETTPERASRLQIVRSRTSASRMRLWRTLENAAFNYDPSADYASDPSCIIGSMSVTCQHCEAKKWKGETPGMCCSGGKVELPQLMDPPLAPTHFPDWRFNGGETFSGKYEKIQFLFPGDIFWHNRGN